MRAKFRYSTVHPPHSRHGHARLGSDSSRIPKGDPYIFLAWQAAHANAWKAPSRDVMLMRMEKAERLGLTYEEYTLEILERGLHLQPKDTDRIAAIKAARKRRRVGRLD
ncbi:hypothetical protein [Mesorhizobium sp.]|uniref:hypothetical protein n=1 Tax=Mesorhizobium sp. TaxID=1871066 RepID=UPI0025802B9A|nr:hypothetical protein [Mesorhizobium sp.]